MHHRLKILHQMVVKLPTSHVQCTLTYGGNRSIYLKIPRTVVFFKKKKIQQKY